MESRRIWGTVERRFLSNRPSEYSRLFSLLGSVLQHSDARNQVQTFSSFSEHCLQHKSTMIAVPNYVHENTLAWSQRPKVNWILLPLFGSNPVILIQHVGLRYDRAVLRWTLAHSQMPSEVTSLAGSECQSMGLKGSNSNVGPSILL